jgi:tetraacyldisaccharide 4'-kinase
MIPLLPLYAAGAVLHWVGSKPKRLAWPVISVGNLSAGGTGKTPFTIALARLLTREGFHVDVLSRGYGRAGTDVERVDPNGSAERFGDEPLLIAREAQVPVYVGAQRFEAGELAEREATTGAGVHLLDDGFQHRHLARQIDIVLINSEDLNDWLLPAGNLREPLGALRRASVFAVPAGDDSAVERLQSMKLQQPIWRFRRDTIVPQLSGPVVAFCGIARPGQFFAGLERAGMTVAARHAFRDHHRFTARDLDLLTALARRTGATALITTEKDRIRLRPLERERAVPSIPLVTVGLRIVFEDETGVAAWLRQALKANSGDCPCEKIEV